MRKAIQLFIEDDKTQLEKEEALLPVITKNYNKSLTSFQRIVPSIYKTLKNHTSQHNSVFVNKEGEVVDYLDKKSLNNIDNGIQDFEFKNTDELDFTIQLYSNDNFENINKYMNNLLENKKEIIDHEDIFVFYKKTEIGTQYFITYKNYISKNNASEACDLLTFVKSCLILNLQN